MLQSSNDGEKAIALTAASPAGFPRALLLSTLPPRRLCAEVTRRSGVVTASFSNEFTLPVGVALCFSFCIRALAPAMAVGGGALPSRLDSARSWFFLDLKRNAMINQGPRAGGQKGRKVGAALQVNSRTIGERAQTNIVVGRKARGDDEMRLCIQSAESGVCHSAGGREGWSQG